LERKNLISELGLSREHRGMNIQRISFVASEITKNRGVAICVPIERYANTGRILREGIEAYVILVEIHVATSIEVTTLRMHDQEVHGYLGL
jgi:sulfate adenylyltransferase